jgi:Xaa-Pro aminopeptidase
VVIEAGAPKTRSNDTEYRYRPHAAFAHLTGWGSRTVADSVLVIDTKQNKDILFLRPTAGKDSDEFFANSAIGEFWVGARPTLEEIASLLDIETRDLAELESFLEGTDKLDLENRELAQFVSELRLVKDPYEIEQMRIAVAASVSGFEDIVRVLPKSVGIPKGERVIETAFFARARQEGNDLGYDTIAAAGKNACVLHWISNDGEVKPNELVLVDAGVEADSLYTADITRTLPVSGKFTPAQKEIYLAVLEAADAAFAIAKPGIKFREIHAAAMKVIAQKTADWGILPVSAEESLDENKQFHRRWMVHGTSHHLGIDVHDCAQARKEMYLDAELEEGMIFTIEPGLYFHEDDLLAPKEFRGIGIRIEDDVLVTSNGVENLTRALPRHPDEIEAWMAKLS